MCLAIWKPKDKKIKKEALKTGYEGNPHGAGFAFAADERLTVVKGFFSFKKFWKAYREIEEHDCLVHFRWATSAEKDEKNCHPWMIDENHCLIHNGVLSLGPDEKENLSDTGRFVRDVFGPIFRESKKLWRRSATQYLIENTIGNGNKFVIMNNLGEAKIFNEKAGEWDNGVWYSNSGYKTPKFRCSAAWDDDECSDWYSRWGGGNYKRGSYTPPKGYTPKSYAPKGNVQHSVKVLPKPKVETVRDPAKELAKISTDPDWSVASDPGQELLSREEVEAIDTYYGMGWSSQDIISLIGARAHDQWIKQQIDCIDRKGALV